MSSTPSTRQSSCLPPRLAVERRYNGGVLHEQTKTGKPRRVPLTATAQRALEQLPPRIDTPLLFPAAEGGYISLGDWTNRDWYPAPEAAGIPKRGPYSLRHTFATEAIANGISPYELAEVMGTSVAMIDRHYGHLRADAHDRIRRLLEGRA
jgi:integrase